jgi:uncharacterized membrane protein YjjB (DUF3815 family)
MIGTVAFSALFGVPAVYYPYCGLIGGAGWAVYSLLSGYGIVFASVIATMVVVLLSRITAVWKRCPVTVFLISGIFPLVPGTYVYWTAYYLVTDQLQQASESGYMALKIAFAIVLGIVLVFEIPQRAFHLRPHR